MYELNSKAEMLEMENEAIIVLDNKKVLSLNKTGKEIIGLLTSLHDMNEICNTLAEQYGIEKTSVATNVNDFLEKALELEVICRND